MYLIFFLFNKVLNPKLFFYSILKLYTLNRIYFQTEKKELFSFNFPSSLLISIFTSHETIRKNMISLYLIS